MAKPTDLCNPSNVEGHDASAPSHTEHLESYQIKRVPGTGKFPKTLNQEVVDQFGTLTIDLLKPERLLVPSASLVSPRRLRPRPSPIISPATGAHLAGDDKVHPRVASVVIDQFGSLS